MSKTQDVFTTREVFLSNTPPEGFKLATKVTQLIYGLPTPVTVDGRELLICREGDSIYAVDEICPHKRLSMRHGLVIRGEIVCPHHQIAFDLTTGRPRHRRCPFVDVFETTLIGDEIYIKLP